MSFRTAIVVLVSASAAFGADGKALFEKKCGFCHASTTDERRVGPSLKGLKNGVMPDAIGKAASDENILKKIEDGGGGMPVFRDLLTKEEKAAIVSYVMRL